MTDEELADRVVRAGYGEFCNYDTGPAMFARPDDSVPEYATDFVCNWAVAGALMERLGDSELTIWQQHYSDGGPSIWIVETHLTNADGRNESLSRAIVEACVSVLEQQ